MKHLISIYRLSCLYLSVAITKQNTIGAIFKIEKTKQQSTSFFDSLTTKIHCIS